MNSLIKNFYSHFHIETLKPVNIENMSFVYNNKGRIQTKNGFSKIARKRLRSCEKRN